MRIQDIMTQDVLAIAPSRPVADALAEMREHRVHHLVVLDGSQVVGILSDRDLAGEAEARTVRTVAEVMSRHVVTATPELTVRDAANLLRGSSIGCLPVFDGDSLVGIVTTTDLLDLIGRGAERPVAESERWTMHARGPTSTRSGGRPKH